MTEDDTIPVQLFMDKCVVAEKILKLIEKKRKQFPGRVINKDTVVTELCLIGLAVKDYPEYRNMHVEKHDPNGDYTRADKIYHTIKIGLMEIGE